MFRRDLLQWLSDEPRSISWLAREMGVPKADVEDALRHALRSARAAGYQVEIVPARCKACGFLFDTNRLTKPGRCPVCRGTRLFEPLVRVRTPA